MGVRTEAAEQLVFACSQPGPTPASPVGSVFNAFQLLGGSKGSLVPNPPNVA